MMKKCFWMCLLVSLPLVFLFGCTEEGKVDQGRVVAFDKDKQLVTIIRDKKMDTVNPEYSFLPPLVYALPQDPAERGAYALGGQDDGRHLSGSCRGLCCHRAFQLVFGLAGSLLKETGRL